MPPPATAAPAPRAAAAAPGASGAIAGQRRAVVHTKGGVVKRGTIEDADLAGAAFVLHGADGAREEIETGGLKAVFLMREAGVATPAPPPDARRVQVTFIDGRPLQGWAVATDHPVGFFVVPSDSRGQADQVFVYRDAIRSLQVD